MKNYGCLCVNCTCFKIHNMPMNIEESLNDQKKPITSGQIEPNKAATLFYAAQTFIRSAGLFTIGLVVGMGIVLKNPTVNKSVQDQLNTLQKENVDLKQVLDTIKNGVIKEKTQDFTVRKSVSIK